MPSKPQPPPADPLADLRDEPQDTRYPDPDEQPEPEEPEAPEAWDAAAAQAQAVARWHKDATSLGFLHKGGRCGCAYVARIGLGG